jgi:hypothetical protein
MCAFMCTFCLPARLSFCQRISRSGQAGRQNPGLSQSGALNPKQQRSALLVLSLPTNKETHTHKTNFRVWWVEKVDLSGAQYLPSKVRPSFSIAIIIALARGEYVISHSCFSFLKKM